MPHPDRKTLVATTNRSEVRPWKGAEGPRRSAEAKRNGLSVGLKNMISTRANCAVQNRLRSRVVSFFKQEHQQSSLVAAAAAPYNAASCDKVPGCVSFPT